MLPTPYAKIETGCGRRIIPTNSRLGDSLTKDLSSEEEERLPVKEVRGAPCLVDSTEK